MTNSNFLIQRSRICAFSNEPNNERFGRRKKEQDAVRIDAGIKLALTELAREVVLGRLGQKIEHPEFWPTVLSFLAVHPEMKLEDVNPIIDIIHANKFAGEEVVTGASRNCWIAARCTLWVGHCATAFTVTPTCAGAERPRSGRCDCESTIGKREWPRLKWTRADAPSSRPAQDSTCALECVPFESHSIDTAFRPLPGNYLYAKQSEEGGWIPIYIAQTRDLHQRLEGHVTLEDAVAHGATHVHVHYSTAGQAARCTEERDLILRWQPVCNDVIES